MDEFIIESPDRSYASSAHSFMGGEVDMPTDFCIKFKCFYLMKSENIYGNLILKKDYICFEPFDPHDVDEAKFEGEEDFLQGNAKLFGAMSNKNTRATLIENCTARIDFLDVIEVNKMPLVNEKAVVHESAFIRDHYRNNIFL